MELQSSQSKTNNKSIKSSCSVLAIGIILVCILIILVGLLVYGSSYLRKIKMPAIRTNTVTESKTISNPSGGLIVTYSEADLSKMLFSDQFPLQDPSLKIKDRITISGKTKDSILSPKIEIELLPKLEQGNVVLEIVKMKAAGFAVPTIIAERISTQIKDKANLAKAPELANYTVEKIELKPGYLQFFTK